MLCPVTRLILTYHKSKISAAYNHTLAQIQCHFSEFPFLSDSRNRGYPPLRPFHRLPHTLLTFIELVNSKEGERAALFPAVSIPTHSRPRPASCYPYHVRIKDLYLRVFIFVLLALGVWRPAVQLECDLRSPGGFKVCQRVRR